MFKCHGLRFFYVRPTPSDSSPFSSIASDAQSLTAMKRAEANPKLAMLSDWDHLTSEEYINAEKVSGLDILFVASEGFICSLLTRYSAV